MRGGSEVRDAECLDAQRVYDDFTHIVCEVWANSTEELVWLIRSLYACGVPCSSGSVTEDVIRDPVLFEGLEEDLCQWSGICMENDSSGRFGMCLYGHPGSKPHPFNTHIVYSADEFLDVYTARRDDGDIDTSGELEFL